MIITLSIAILLVLMTCYIHLISLKLLSASIPKINISSYNQVLIIIITLFLVHLIEIGLYSLAYELSISYFNLGELHGDAIDSIKGYFYYSMAMYTSLGLGDLYPIGNIRFITGVEALNGLMLITWSASFTFLAMKRLWPWSDNINKKDNK